MGTVSFLCYADSNMITSQLLCLKSAKKFLPEGPKFAFTPNDIGTEFYNSNKKILDSPQRGGGTGFWLFKPYFVEKVVRSCQDGDYVIYADSGIEFIHPIDMLIKQMERTGQNIFVFGNNHRHVEWTKLEVLQQMIPDSTENSLYRIYEREQVQASVMIFKVDGYTREFCKRWLLWCQIPGMIDDKLRGAQMSSFKEHRNDQSILTNLCINDGITLHWWPAQYGHYVQSKYPYDNYPQLFYHHRYRESDWSKYGKGIDAFMLEKKTL